MAGFSVIIPARNEARVIARTIETLTRDVDWTSMELIVVCNGCDDDTASVARGAAPRAMVVELGAVGKCGAINAGLERANHDIALIVDADVGIAPRDLRALAAALADGGADAVSPLAAFDTSRSDAAVRAYYRVYSRHAYQATGVGGSGVYGFSGEARRYLAPFPPVVGDDEYVRGRVPIDRQRRLATDAEGHPVTSTVIVPATLGALLRLEGRWRRGDAQLRKAALPTAHAHGLPRGVRVTDLMIYIAIKLVGRALALSPRGSWYQDRSSRQAS